MQLFKDSIKTNITETRRYKRKSKGKRNVFPCFSWRGREDLNLRDAFYTSYSLSRGAPSASWVLPQVDGKIQLAERVGFEPTDAFTSPVFKTGAFNRSAISPDHEFKSSPKRRYNITTSGRGLSTGITLFLVEKRFFVKAALDRTGRAPSSFIHRKASLTPCTPRLPVGRRFCAAGDDACEGRSP